MALVHLIDKLYTGIGTPDIDCILSQDGYIRKILHLLALVIDIVYTGMRTPDRDRISSWHMKL